ncbi:hypothetical protein NR798_46355 [Archangium gephyra]|uniref:hypothetical protein n=1 Tax=Archangium gephyra TaxID=48 RepID=UPI0035D4C84B
MQHNFVLDHIRGVGKRLVITGSIFLPIALFCLKTLTSVMGDMSSKNLPGFLLFIAPFPLMALFCIGFGLFCLLRPEDHPNLASLEKTGAGARSRLYTELRDTARLQVQNPHGLKLGLPGGVVFSDNFLLTLTPWGLQVRSLADLAWVHSEDEDVRYNGAHVQTNLLLRLRFLGQKDLRIGFRTPPEREEMMSFIVSQRPGAVAGYSEERRKLWMKDRRAFASRARAA